MHAARLSGTAVCTRRRTCNFRANTIAEKRELLKQTIIPLQKSDVLSDDYQVVERYFEANDNSVSEEVEEYIEARSRFSRHILG